MANLWFRMYSEFATDPKVQMLSEAYQRRYLMLLCLRCSNGDVTLQDEEVAFQLRISNEEWAETKVVLTAKGLVDDGNKPSAWDHRQYVSDSSASRVSRHRLKKKLACNVTATPPDTDTDTDTDTEKKKDRLAQEIKDPVSPTAQPKAKPPAKGSRLSPEWVLPKQWGEWALKERLDLSSDDVRREADNFRDHWLSTAGAKGIKADWLATWRKWIRSDYVKPSGKEGNTAKSGHWFMSSTGIEAKGIELGIAKVAGEIFPQYRARVYQSAGVTEAMVRKAKIDNGERV